jgi:hypothetical protein
MTIEDTIAALERACGELRDDLDGVVMPGRLRAAMEAIRDQRYAGLTIDFAAAALAESAPEAGKKEGGT